MDPLRAHLALQHVHRRVADEERHEAVGRAFIDVGGRCQLLQLALTHHGDQVGHGERFGLVMGDIDRGGAEAVAETLDLAAHGEAQARIEVGERLVHEKRGGIADDRACQGHALRWPPESWRGWRSSSESISRACATSAIFLARVTGSTWRIRSG